jgi:hypothetical protein
LEERDLSTVLHHDRSKPRLGAIQLSIERETAIESQPDLMDIRAEVAMFRLCMAVLQAPEYVR